MKNSRTAQRLSVRPPSRYTNNTMSDILFSLPPHTDTRKIMTKLVIFLTCAALSGLGLTVSAQSLTYAAQQKQNASACSSWYTITSRDTLTFIAKRYKTTVSTLASINRIANINLIFVGQRLCINNRSTKPANSTTSGIQKNGTIHWYAYNALDKSSKQQVETLLRQAAARYKLPANLVLAIAWQESGWQQHVISHDGGIGTMQLMPYTAMSMNSQLRTRYDPYKLADNITLGTAYLHSLWQQFHGNKTLVISAYNQGAWNVIHRGVLNQRYVNNVLALMRKL
jgi:soluble lytic murein transglycosylase-like protein